MIVFVSVTHMAVRQFQAFNVEMLHMMCFAALQFDLLFCVRVCICASVHARVCVCACLRVPVREALSYVRSKEVV